MPLPAPTVPANALRPLARLIALAVQGETVSVEEDGRPTLSSRNRPMLPIIPVADTPNGAATVSRKHRRRPQTDEGPAQLPHRGEPLEGQRTMCSFGQEEAAVKRLPSRRTLGLPWLR